MRETEKKGVCEKGIERERDGELERERKRI